ncbi:uncharacterized protein LOC134263134 [Saccostrea cucullata]|uniref:uncharacterized protein LOC134263134 n=1 Tax=Saccostrea cuccullata TaxID=36930 RepID=UPI002ED39732
MTSTRKWSTAAWTMSGTSADTQVQPEGGVLVLTVLTVVSVTFVVFGLLFIYCFCFQKRKRNGMGKCPASAQNLNLQERGYSDNKENVQSVVKDSYTPSECLYVSEKNCWQTCSQHHVTSKMDDLMSQKKTCV